MWRSVLNVIDFILRWAFRILGVIIFLIIVGQLALFPRLKNDVANELLRSLVLLTLGIVVALVLFSPENSFKETLSRIDKERRGRIIFRWFFFVGLVITGLAWATSTGLGEDFRAFFYDTALGLGTGFIGSAVLFLLLDGVMQAITSEEEAKENAQLYERLGELSGHIMVLNDKVDVLLAQHEQIETENQTRKALLEDF